MSKLLVTALTFTILAFIVAGGYHLASKSLTSDNESGAYGKLPQVEEAETRDRDDRSLMVEMAEPTPEAGDAVSQFTAEADIIVKVPVVTDQEAGNPLSGVIVTGYQDMGVTTGNEFIITPAYDDLNNRIDTNTVLSERFRLVGIKNHTIELERYVTKYDLDEDGEYEASPEWQEIRLTTKACFDAVTTLLDVAYQLCLDTTEDSDGTPILTYEFIGRSTMPAVQ